MHHDDGDQTFVDAGDGVSTARMIAGVDALLRSEVKTVSYCIGTGVLMYPSKVGSPLGWRSTPFDTRNGWERIAFARAAMKRGEDPIRAGAARLRENGRIVLLSHRINDAHFMKAVDTYPLVPEFYLQNRNLIIGKENSPVENDPDYGNLLDFTHERVRHYNRDIVIEAADRYRDVIDGLEIDFVRDQFLFPRGKGAERAGLITAMLADIRRHLDQLSKRLGRPMYLTVRVPPTLKSSKWAGLDVRTWMENHLVDAVVPSQLMTIAPDQDVAEFAKISKATGVKLHPAILSRQNFSWALTPQSIANPSNQTERASVTVEDATAVATNYFSQGADGIQLYNWAARAWVQSDWFRTLAERTSKPERQRGASMVFAVTPAFYFDLEDTYEPAKQLPATIRARAAEHFTLFVGTDLVRDKPRQVVLRIGMDRPATPSMALSLKVNGRPVPVSLEASSTRATAATPQSLSAKPPKRYPPPAVFVHVPIDDALIQMGKNRIEIGSNQEVEVREIRLGVFRTGG